MKCFRFVIVILSSTWHLHNAAEDVFTTIFASSGNLYLGESNNLDVAQKIKNFERTVNCLALSKDHLYVSVKRSHGTLKADNAILRAKLTSNSSVDDQSWEVMDTIKNYSQDVKRMVIAKGYIFGSRRDQVVWRCSVDHKNFCEEFYRLNGSISGITHDIAGDKIYLSSSSGHLWRCSLDKDDSCEAVHFPGRNLMTVKIAFDALWLGVGKENAKGCWLMKCPVPKVMSKFNSGDCQLYEDHFKNEIFVESIQATDRYLYINFWNGKKIYRCDPYKNSPCSDSISVPRNATRTLDSFIIYKKNN